MKRLLVIAISFYSLNTYSQVGIGTSSPNASAQLEVNASNKGFLPPRVALTSRIDVTTIPSPATGLLVYNTATAGFYSNSVTPGYYFYGGSSWTRLATITSIGDLSDVKFNETNFLFSLLIGSRTTGTLSSANYNTGVGLGVFETLTSGVANAALGSKALGNITSGTSNTALGYFTLYNHTTGSFNTAIGSQALSSNVSGYSNTAVGSGALSAATGNYNTAVGSSAGAALTTGEWNTLVGNSSLASSTSGTANSGLGYQSLYNNSTGSYNTAFGFLSMSANTTGTYNTALGANANVASANLTNATAIGYNASVNASNTIQLGNASITDVKTSGTITAVGFQTLSDARLKTNIREIDEAMDIVMQLKPFTYDKKSSITASSYENKEIGFLAQDVQAVLPQLVREGQDADKTLSVNYTALIPVLTKAIQEQQKTIVEQQQFINETREELQQLRKAVEKRKRKDRKEKNMQ